MILRGSRIGDWLLKKKQNYEQPASSTFGHQLRRQEAHSRRPAEATVPGEAGKGRGRSEGRTPRTGPTMSGPRAGTDVGPQSPRVGADTRLAHESAMAVTSALPGSDTPCGQTQTNSVQPHRKLEDQQTCLQAVAVECGPVCDRLPLHPEHSQALGPAAGGCPLADIWPQDTAPLGTRGTGPQDSGPTRPQPWALQKLGGGQYRQPPEAGC